jgi:hypothetical protein
LKFIHSEETLSRRPAVWLILCERTNPKVEEISEHSDTPKGHRRRIRLLLRREEAELFIREQVSEFLEKELVEYDVAKFKLDLVRNNVHFSLRPTLDGKITAEQLDNF